MVTLSCECFNQTLFGLLKTLKAEEKADWPSHLPALVFTYNATPHASTSYQPYQLMFGHRAPAPCDIMHFVHIMTISRSLI